ncbi:hypothetical protein DFJ73DRAFT_875357 [Zopfochytrium polystomum]|nr:hypothetical protein DFJ73DRAFT_875357 [Zopfochytrium polystomum]
MRLHQQDHQQQHPQYPPHNQQQQQQHIAHNHWDTYLHQNVHQQHQRHYHHPPAPPIRLTRTSSSSMLLLHAPQQYHPYSSSLDRQEAHPPPPPLPAAWLAGSSRQPPRHLFGHSPLSATREPTVWHPAAAPGRYAPSAPVGHEVYARRAPDVALVYQSDLGHYRPSHEPGGEAPSSHAEQRFTAPSKYVADPARRYPEPYEMARADDGGRGYLTPARGEVRYRPHSPPR